MLRTAVLWIYSLGVCGDVALTLSARLSLTKSDDRELMLQENRKLIQLAKDNNIHSNFILFLQNMEGQIIQVLEAAKHIKEEKEKVPTEFASGKYKLKALKKLRAKAKKKNTITEKKLDEFLKMTSSATGFEVEEPFVIRNATQLFKDWEGLRRHWTAERISTDEYLEENARLAYRKPDSPIYRFEGNYRYWIPPQQIPFSRYYANCFLGTPAAPKIPGQATEHCEKTIDATKFVRDPDELENFNIFPGMKNSFSDFKKWNIGIMEHLTQSNATKKALNEREKEFFDDNQEVQYRFFTFGPSGSGEKLHMENNLPFFDVLIHGMRRWLLVKSEEVDKVAAKAKEAMEFRQTSAYMFFEEKLPELVEEFGLKNYVEVNQEPGDVMVVPQGWYRVSLSLADSISYYEQLLKSDKIISEYVNHHTWFPRYNMWRLGYCFDPKEVVKGTGGLSSAKDNHWLEEQFYGIGDTSLITFSTLEALIYCGRIMSSNDKLAINAVKDTKCTPKVWKECRKRLIDTVTQVVKKAKESDFDFIPKTPPKQFDKSEDKSEGKKEEL